MELWYKPVVFWSTTFNRWHARDSRGIISYIRDWNEALDFALGKEKKDASEEKDRRQE